MNHNHCLKGIESPRIYTYKITFKDTPYYYYGVHKEKRFNEEYLGSPSTNKWCWDLYEAERQILEVFEYSDEGWIYANKVEQRLILPVFNNDPNCLNECCAGVCSLEVRRRTGKKNGKKNYERGIGIHALTKEQKAEIAKKAYNEGKGLASLTKEQLSEIGKNNYANGIGFATLTKEQRSENGKKGIHTQMKNGIGIYALSKEERSELGRKNGKDNYEKGIGIASISKERRSEIGRKTYEQGIGLHSLTKEQRQEISKKTYQEGKGLASLTKEQKDKRNEKVNKQKWKCLVTGKISTLAGLSMYQKNRGIDTSKRVRIA